MIKNKTFSQSSSSCCVTGTNGKRITREERITLRNISAYKKSWADKVFENIHNGVSELGSWMMTPLRKDNKNSMCKFYGHVIQGPWKGYLPKCADCGIEISSPDQLRKASALK